MSKRTKRTITVIGAVLLVLLAALFAAYAAANHYLDKMNKVDGQATSVVQPADEDFETDEDGDETPDTSQVDPDQIGWAESGSLQDEDLINILLVGQDRRPGQGRQRSDSMILCSFNPENGKLSIISFLRDLYVQIPGGYSDNRLNAAYAFGGFPLLKDTLHKNFGVTIDGCFEVDFDGFTSVIDTVGGVDIKLTAKEAQYIGGGVTEGTNHLSGAQALTYARIRKLDSDFGRTNRQRTVLLALYQAVKGSDAQSLLDLLDTLLPMLSTDMTNNEILATAMKVLPAFNSLQISTHHVPANDAFYFARVRGMSVLIPDRKLIKEQLQNEYLPFA